MVQSLWRTVWSFLKNLNLELPYHPEIPLLGIYQEKMKILIQKDTCIPKFTAALIIIAKTWEQPKCPLTGMDKDMVHIYSGKVLSHKK